MKTIKEELKKPIGWRDFLKKPLVFFLPILIPILLIGAYIVGMVLFVGAWKSPPLLYYLIFALCLQIIARKTKTEGSWLAWIPIFNLYLMLKIAGRSGLELILFFIPIVNLVVWVGVWKDIALARNMSPEGAWGIGITMLIPFLNFIPLMILATSPQFWARVEKKL